MCHNSCCAHASIRCKMGQPTNMPGRSKFSIDFFTNSRRRFFATVVLILLIGGVAGYYLPRNLPQIIRPALAQGQRNYTLVIQGADIQEGSNAVWHAWTYNGTVPGPTLHAKVGEILQVTVINNLNLHHSFHTHLAPYSFDNDGSQANVITNVGAAGMIAPNGGSYVYQFQLTEAGLFYYHCHSSDGGYMINQHILQGLYGAIVVDKPDQPPVRDNTIFMAEIGFQCCWDRLSNLHNERAWYTRRRDDARAGILLWRAVRGRWTVQRLAPSF